MGWRWLLVALLALAVGLFFWRLGERDLWSSHEARAALNTRWLLESDSALPRLDDDRSEAQKPPLYYWLAAGVPRLRGGLAGGRVHHVVAEGVEGVAIREDGLDATATGAQLVDLRGQLHTPLHGMP